MTADELVTLTKQVSGERTSTTRDDTWFLDRVNEAYRWVTGYRNKQTGTIMRFDALRDRLTRVITASPATNFLAHQTAVRSILSIYNVTDNRPMDWKPSRILERKDRTSTGSVTMWTNTAEAGVEGYYFWRLPTVNTSLEEFVYKYPVALPAGATSPVIPEDWHAAIYLEAGARAAKLGGDRSMYTDLHQQAAIEIETHSVEIDPRVGPTISHILAPPTS